LFRDQRIGLLLQRLNLRPNLLDGRHGAPSASE
jgi:hypothetical protein